MWWIQTTGYHLAGLVWLIVIAAIFLIAVGALSAARSAMTRSRETRKMLGDHIAQASAIPTTSPAVVVDGDRMAAASGVGNSLSILHERYARGEMTREEYLQAREDMTTANPIDAQSRDHAPV